MMKSPTPSRFAFVRDDVGQTFLPIHGLAVLSSLLSLSCLILTPSHEIASMSLFPFCQ